MLLQGKLHAKKGLERLSTPSFVVLPETRYEKIIELLQEVQINVDIFVADILNVNGLCPTAALKNSVIRASVS